MDTQKIISEITEIYRQQGVVRVILFGSYAYGNPRADSDIDLMIVVPLETLPSTHREKVDLYLLYDQFIKHLRSIIPIDLIIYTKAAYDKFIELGSVFSQEITNHGVILYENNIKGLA
jgi:predicted nucleotidyltransferase